MDQLDRIFQVHRRLHGRRTAVSFEDLRLELDCSRATLRRCISYLRDTFGAPLVHDREQGGYRYDGDGLYELPGLWFSAEELAALLVLDELIERQPLGLLAGTLAPFRARLEKLATRAGLELSALRPRLRLLRMAARPTGEQFAQVAEALGRRLQLRIDYHTRHDDRMAPRTVSPQRLCLYRDNWYLDAWCHERQALRTFALDRIIAAEIIDAPAETIPEEHLDRSLGTSYGIFSGTPTAMAVLHFTPHAARWVAAETWHPEQADTRQPDGSLLRRLPYRHDEELLMDLLRWGPEVLVLGPDQLRDVVVQRLAATLGRYGVGSEMSAGLGSSPQRFTQNGFSP